MESVILPQDIFVEGMLMYTGSLVFTQVMDFMPLKTFNRCVEKYNGNFSVKHFTCLDQFRIMAFAQLTYRESLRDIEACLGCANLKLIRERALC